MHNYMHCRPVMLHRCGPESSRTDATAFVHYMWAYNRCGPEDKCVTAVYSL